MNDINKNTALSKSSKNILTKIIEDQKAIAAYFRGELSISDLKAKGIKFVRPV